MGAYNFIAGETNELQPIPPDRASELLHSCDKEWLEVGNFVPQALSLHIYRCDNHQPECGPNFRVRVSLDRDLADDIYCDSLSELLKLLGNMAPIALLMGEIRSARLHSHDLAELESIR